MDPSAKVRFLSPQNFGVMKTYYFPGKSVVELVDTIGLEPVDFKRSCGFESHLSKAFNKGSFLLVQWKNFGLLSRLCRFESYREL